ncbi:hypothetical protein SARC_00318 [Sphaeroforma arctica JP610]|uniref:Uncharacterized protein n=1 Tax=Sphaeroforma arctica JP610 TaxID=667725 RepID=A0A0L0GGT4_9EUKA|nr:hypothetical protein SARC_00318 [Sphaeroforma arctica JP610]KNC87553.1 hypothetical protein SARC_00318 [Sphaeroforma arctica JP610]|eukprot:XP_014161455.1 hypothetical protein SARC_00318 [Sphaeroforma arctica JP610]
MANLRGLLGGPAGHQVRGVSGLGSPKPFNRDRWINNTDVTEEMTATELERLKDSGVIRRCEEQE